MARATCRNFTRIYFGLIVLWSHLLNGWPQACVGCRVGRMLELTPDTIRVNALPGLLAAVPATKIQRPIAFRAAGALSGEVG